MKFTLSWLKKYLETQVSPEDIAHRLTMLGLEVEKLEDPTSQLKGFVVGHIIEANQHPNADRLKLCQVDTGKAILQIVCGAPNARKNLKVALALPGTIIPNTGQALKTGLVRGVESQGMMCSSQELCLGDDHDGLIELPDDSPIGSKLIDILPLDPIFDISITPNRSDCLGVRGIARDLAASGLGNLKPFTIPKVKASYSCPIQFKSSFPGEQKQACPLFIGRSIKGLKNSESPDWLKKYLSASGQKPISKLVDITNFIMLEHNRPLHVFDQSKISHNLTVRFAKTGETLKALNEKDYNLSSDHIVIADSDSVLSLGGIMGGQDSGVTLETTEIVLEAALFDPEIIAKTGRHLMIDSEARYRFERGIDSSFTLDGIELATAMIIDLCGGEASELVILGDPPLSRNAIAFKTSKTEELVGIHISSDQQRNFLEALGCVLSSHNKDEWQVIPPPWRHDLNKDYDLIEEIIRLYGYDSIPEIPLDTSYSIKPILTIQQRRHGWIRRELASRGLNETVSFSFVSKRLATFFAQDQELIELENPMSADLEVMRPSLIPHLLESAQHNKDRGLKHISLFEIGPQFKKTNDLHQETMIAAIRLGPSKERHWTQALTLLSPFDAKADLMAVMAAVSFPTENLHVMSGAPSWYHPGRSGTVKIGQKIIGWFGEFHPQLLKYFDWEFPVIGFELYLDSLPIPKVKTNKSRPTLITSPFQSIERDFAFIVDVKTPADHLLKAVRACDKDHIVAVELFDIYQGNSLEKDKKSLALQVTLQPIETTMTEHDIEAITKKIIDAALKIGAILRH